MKRIGRVIATLALVGFAAAGAYELWIYYMVSPWTRDARVRADVVDIAPDVAGFVNDLRVKDNEFVHKGDILFVIDQDRYRLALATAEATVAARKADMEMHQHEAERRAKLTSIAISDEGRENARHVADSAKAALDQARADSDTARLNLGRTVVHAPVNGFVTNLVLDVGQYAPVGGRIMALIDSDSYRVEGYFEETKIPSIKLGNAVKIQLMSGGPDLRGHVESISRGITDRDNGSGPELLANVNPTFEWVRLAQRIPVRVHIDEVPEGVLVSAGMTCTVAVAAPPRPWATSELLSEARSLLGELAARQSEAAMVVQPDRAKAASPTFLGTSAQVRSE